MEKKKKSESQKKTVKKKRQRVDGVDAAIKIVQAAHLEIKPPPHIRMTKKDVPFFESVIAEFSRAEWTDHQLEIAALLARAMCDMEDEQFMLRKEGSMLTIKSKKKKNKPANKYSIVNPRKSLVQMSAGTVMSLRRSLSLHARARAGEGRDIGPRRAAERQLESAAKSFDDVDNLIARPAQIN